MGPEETLQVKTLLLVPLLVPLLVLLLVPLLGLLLVLLPVLLLVLLVLTPLLQIRVLAHAEAWVLLDALLEGRTGAASQEEERRQAASLYGALCASLLRSRPSEFMFRAVAVNLERSLRQHAGLEVRSSTMHCHCHVSRPQTPIAAHRLTRVTFDLHRCGASCPRCSGCSAPRATTPRISSC